MSNPYRTKLCPAPRVELLKKSVSSDDVKINVLSYMRNLQEQIDVADKVHRVLNAWNNRRVNVRIQKEIEASLGSGYNVYYGKPTHDLDCVEVTIWSRDHESYRSYENRFIFRIAHADSMFVINSTTTDEAVSRYTIRQVEELELLKKQLPSIEEKMAAYNTILPQVQAVLNNMVPFLKFTFEDARL